MPDFPIVDTHVHLWFPNHFRMSWLDDIELLNKTYDLDTYNEHTREVNIGAMVYLEVDINPAYGLLEAEYIVGLADLDPRLQGIVAWAPLEDGERVRPYLQKMVSIDPRIKGIRRIIQSEPDPQFSLRPDFVRGVQLLPEYGLSCDLCITASQLPATIELVRRCPQVSFILDHIGKPDIKNHMLDPWRSGMAELAALPNVVCKVSGMVTEADWAHWVAGDLAPYVAHVLDVFGEDRVMYGGDWPVAYQASSYVRWVQTLDTLTAHLSPQARHKLWADNARRVYRLPTA